MHDLDKQGMGPRIRQIRLTAKLRQWELAKLLGTTQSAVHKYEHGVVPEPRRLVTLARIGGTSIEWILTGVHWENGSPEQERLSSDLLQTARTLREISDHGKDAADQALGIMRDAIRALDASTVDETDPRVAACANTLREHADVTVRLLESAWRIQRAILQRVEQAALARLENPASRSRPPA